MTLCRRGASVAADAVTAVAMTIIESLINGAPPLDTQVLAGLAQGREAAALAAGSSRAGDAGRQGHKTGWRGGCGGPAARRE